MPLPQITPQQARDLAAKGAQLVDVREPREFAAEHIEGAVNMPLSSLGGQTIGNGGDIIIFHCKSGTRTNLATRQLERAANGKAMVMGGGLMAWKMQGLPTWAAAPTGKAGPSFFSRLFSKS